MAEEKTDINPTAKSQSDEPEDKKPEATKDKTSPSGNRWQRFKAWYATRKKWTIPATVLLVVLVLIGIPFTRYAIVGTVIKRDLNIQVLDSATRTPVSGAVASFGAVSGQTDANGRVTLHHIQVGHHKVMLSKKYYQTKIIDVLVPVLSQKKVAATDLVATGRQVKISIKNLISQKALKGVTIKISGTTAQTDQTGSAIVVLPAGVTEQKASLSLDGFNDAAVTVKASNDKIQDNQFSLTPAGKVYFLSKLSGKIDVVKTNLDGTDRQTVLAGTGKEDDRSTVLLASRDWKYLALLSRRAGNSPTLYLIDTSNDSLSTIDEGNADFSLAGWVGSSFVYTVTRNNVQLWQPGRQAIKSFNAVTKKITVLDQTTASGSDSFNYLTELVGPVYAYDGQVFYIKNWSASYTGTASIADKQATFNSIKPDGSAKKAIRSFGMPAGTTAIDVTLEERVKSPNAIELKFTDPTKDHFYVYTNGQVKDDSSMSADTFYGANPPTYLQSPSANQTFWSESRDGKNTLFIGDEDGANGKQIAILSDYSPYGWFSDNYLLVSKNSSELYIMDKSGRLPAVKVSDYHKPSLTFPGYGGGYGGL